MFTLELADSGVWRCIPENDVGQLAVNFELQVVIPAGITELQGPTGVVVGNQSVTFVCVVSGQPPPDVYWFHSGAANEQETLVAKKPAGGDTELQIVPGPSSVGMNSCGYP